MLPPVAVAVVVLVVECVWWLLDDVGREESAAGAGTGMDAGAGAGVAPQRPKTQPPTFLVMPTEPVAGPSLFRGPRFWCAMLELSSVRCRSLLAAFLANWP